MPFNVDESPWGNFTYLVGVVPIPVTGKFTIQLGRMKDYENARNYFDPSPPRTIAQFDVLGKVQETGRLAPFDPEKLTILQEAAPCMITINYGFYEGSRAPVTGNTITINGTVLTFLDRYEDYNDPETQILSQNYPLTAYQGITDYVNSHPQLNMSVENQPGLPLKLTSTLPGLEGNTASVTSDVVDCEIIVTPAILRVFGPVEQYPNPAGYAAFPGQYGDLMAYIVRGTYGTSPPVDSQSGWADPKQLLILKALTEYLEEIEGIDVQDRDENGMPLTNQDGSPTLVQKSLLGRVYRGRSVFGQEEYDPFLSILEGKKPDQLPQEVGDDRLVREEIWHLLIQGFQEDDEANPLDNLYRLKAMVEAHLAKLVMIDVRNGTPMYPEIFRLGGMVNDMTIGPGLVRPANPSQGGTEAFFLPISVTFVMNVGDPYTV